MASLETGEGCFELHYDFSNAKDYSLSSLINNYFRVSASPHIDKIPVITSVTQINENQVEIKRSIINKNYHQNVGTDLPEEVIVVDRNQMRQKSGVVMQMLGTYPGFKQEAMKIFAQGYLVQRCLLDRDACKAFANPQSRSMQLLGDVYMYKQLQNCKRIVDLIEDNECSKMVKDDLNALRMSDLLDLV